MLRREHHTSTAPARSTAIRATRTLAGLVVAITILQVYGAIRPVALIRLAASAAERRDRLAAAALAGALVVLSLERPQIPSGSFTYGLFTTSIDAVVLALDNSRLLLWCGVLAFLIRGAHRSVFPRKVSVAAAARQPAETVIAGGAWDSGTAVPAGRWIALCLSVPAAVLTGAFIWLAIDHRAFGLWNVVVHESGRYTLGQTVFYVSHFLREIPTVLAMALFIVSTSNARIDAPGERDRRTTLVWTMVALSAACLIVAVSFARVSLADGTREALQNLIQSYTRDDVQAYGSHWRFHFLSTIWFALAVPVSAWVGYRFLGGPTPGEFRRSRTWRVAWLYFLALTVVFGLSLEPILDPRFIGHQAREILTHALTTLPLGLGLLAAVHRLAGVQCASRPGRWPTAALAGVMLIPAYLGIAVFATDAMATGQTERGLAAVVAAHFFEHVLDFVLAGCLVVGIEGLRLWSSATTTTRSRFRP
jgi:hypothetical protein